VYTYLVGCTIFFNKYVQGVRLFGGVQAYPYKRTGRPFAKAFLRHLNHGFIPRFFSICYITSQYIILLTKKFKFLKFLMQILARHSFCRVKFPTSPFTHEWTSSSNYSSAFLPSVSVKKSIQKMQFSRNRDCSKTGNKSNVMLY